MLKVNEEIASVSERRVRQKMFLWHCDILIFMSGIVAGMMLG